MKRAIRKNGYDVINQRTNSISPEKRELYKHRLEIVQSEGLLEARDKDIIPDRHESPHEKQNCHYRERTTIRLPTALSSTLHRLPNCSNACHVSFSLYLILSQATDNAHTPAALQSYFLAAEEGGDVIQKCGSIIHFPAS